MAKVHLITGEGARRVRIACGQYAEGFLCDGYQPRDGSPGEYETAIDERFEATTFRDDVTCKRCMRTGQANAK